MQRRILALVVAVCCAPVAFGKAAFAQDQAPVTRKLVSKVMPGYPSLARAMNITGVVRVEAFVNANGTVKTVEVRGGNPVLVEAAMAAIFKWKWEPASHETHESVELRFDPH